MKYDSMIKIMKEQLTIKGYDYKSYGDYCLGIQFSNCKVEIWETISNGLYFKVINNNGEKVFAKTYKSPNNVFRYGFKNII